jgi:hypothetical protein
MRQERQVAKIATEFISLLGDLGALAFLARIPPHLFPGDYRTLRVRK